MQGREGGGGKVLFMTDFHISVLDRAGDNVMDWRCTDTKSKCKARKRTEMSDYLY